MTTIGIAGCTGRMGVALLHEALQHDEIREAIGSVRTAQMGGALDQLCALGLDSNRISLTDNPEELFKADAVIDFTRPSYSMLLAEHAAESNVALICGTTGLSDAQFDDLRQYAKKTRIIWSSNMSVGVNMLQGLVQRTAELLDDAYDIEIVEMHHKHKVDAPSGTALSLGRAAAKGRGVDFDEKAVLSREGDTGERKTGDIGFATLRGGRVIGDHSVIFAGEKDRIELSHSSQSREIYAEGAIRAALWAQKQPNGFYSMQDVLGL